MQIDLKSFAEHIARFDDAAQQEVLGTLQYTLAAAVPAWIGAHLIKTYAPPMDPHVRDRTDAGTLTPTDRIWLLAEVVLHIPAIVIVLIVADRVGAFFYPGNSAFVHSAFFLFIAHSSIAGRADAAAGLGGVKGAAHSLKNPSDPNKEGMENHQHEGLTSRPPTEHVPQIAPIQRPTSQPENPPIRRSKTDIEAYDNVMSSGNEPMAANNFGGSSSFSSW